jgi:hypothetical protein
MKNTRILARENTRSARHAWGELDHEAMRQLRSLTAKYRLSVASGDLQLLSGRWYVTHTGLLGIAQRRKCAGMNAVIVKSLCNASVGRWVVKATVQRSLRRTSLSSGLGNAHFRPADHGRHVRGIGVAKDFVCRLRSEGC